MSCKHEHSWCAKPDQQQSSEWVVLREALMPRVHTLPQINVRGKESSWTVVYSCVHRYSPRGEKGWHLIFGSVNTAGHFQEIRLFKLWEALLGTGLWIDLIWRKCETKQSTKAANQVWNSKHKCFSISTSEVWSWMLVLWRVDHRALGRESRIDVLNIWSDLCPDHTLNIPRPWSL